jgi:hypothetical protein
MSVNSILKYAITVFLSAFLLFQIQPMIAKMILPWFGGSAAVWITCMVFFQVALLGGYIYAHLLVNKVGAKYQTAVHSVLLLGSLILLPVTPGLNWKPAGGEEPILRILGLLSASVGLPYFLLSTTSPLIQAWYAKSHGSILPYRLFALSNLASLLGLLAYPFLVEPLATLRQQSLGWSVPYAVFVALCFILSLGNMKKENRFSTDSADMLVHAEDETPAPSFREKVLWLMLSACASLLLLSITNHLTQNIASIPFLWVLPLSLYLLTFILCFERSGWYSRKVYLWLILGAIGSMSYGLVYWEAGTSLKIVVPVYCMGLFLCCMFCHGELASRKPSSRYLTDFYLQLSFGGALGGITVGLLAPNIFSGYFELIAGLFLCASLLFMFNLRKSRLAAALCGLLVTGVFVAGAIYIHDYAGYSLLNVRSFYGTLRVRDYDAGTDAEYRSLVHGAINHGSQFTSPEKRDKPLTYYSATSGVGRAIIQLQKARPVKIGVIGLGAGSIAAYARKGDEVRFYEINPSVEDIARRYFYYLADSKGKVDVIIGDGRLSLEREKPQDYDVLAVDAFSGDSIPVHLLTKEAFELYFKHIKRDGILAVHISNKHLNLGPVVEKLCGGLGKKCVLIDDFIEEEDEDENQTFGSDWALISSDDKFFKVSEIDKASEDLPSLPDMKIWTDDYSNLFQILKK